MKKYTLNRAQLLIGLYSCVFSFLSLSFMLSGQQPPLFILLVALLLPIWVYRSTSQISISIFLFFIMICTIFSFNLGLRLNGWLFILLIALFWRLTYLMQNQSYLFTILREQFKWESLILLFLSVILQLWSTQESLYLQWIPYLILFVLLRLTFLSMEHLSFTLFKSWMKSQKISVLLMVGLLLFITLFEFIGVPIFSFLLQGLKWILYQLFLIIGKILSLLIGDLNLTLPSNSRFDPNQLRDILITTKQFQKNNYTTSRIVLYLLWAFILGLLSYRIYRRSGKGKSAVQSKTSLEKREFIHLNIKEEKKQPYPYSKPNNPLRKQYQELLGWFKTIGVQRHTSETPQELANRLNSSTLQELTDYYEQERYGGHHNSPTSNTDNLIKLIKNEMTQKKKK